MISKRLEWPAIAAAAETQYHYVIWEIIVLQSIFHS